MSIMIQLSELHFSTSEDFKILEDIHLQVERGEMLFLTGKKNRGKSALLDIIAGHCVPQRGQVLVCGRNTARLSENKRLALRQKIGYLPQFAVVLDSTVLECVIFKLRALGDFREEAEEKALVALEMVGLADQLAKSTDKLHDLELRQLGLALAICNEPVLILCDEPFTKLSGEGRAKIVSTLQRLHHTGMTVLVTAELPLPDVENSYRVVKLDEGRVVRG